jgi:hypothetical protein
MAEDSVNVLFLFLFFAFVLSVRQNQLLSQELKGSFDTNTFDDKNWRKNPQLIIQTSWGKNLSQVFFSTKKKVWEKLVCICKLQSGLRLSSVPANPFQNRETTFRPLEWKWNENSLPTKRNCLLGKAFLLSVVIFSVVVTFCGLGPFYIAKVIACPHALELSFSLF